jgi:hypothetical protein
MLSYAAQLRQELSARNCVYAKKHGLAHALSHGGVPVTVYEPCDDGKRHGNFLNVSYTAILKQPEWKCRLEKIHAQAKSIPNAERAWKELDSCMSSDALLMNVFCHPRVLKNKRLISALGIEAGQIPKFGFPARVALRNGGTDRTEVDMKIGTLLVESKLTESYFQFQDAKVVERYRDLEIVFECRQLPRLNGKYVSYQLIRNVLAAHALQLSFCVLLDSRRPDLLEAWYAIMKCVSIPELKTRCKVVTWQELALMLPRDVQKFLDVKYGIVPPGCTASPV